jgi:predicted RNA binding protein YcfA (HicA-like mRNA interferase family)
MSRLPRLKGKDLIRILERRGLVLGPGLLRSILRDVDLSSEDLVRDL